MKEHTLAYMAGVMDGDGTLAVVKHGQYSACVQLSKWSKPLMDFVQLHFGGVVSKKTVKSGKDFYMWSLYGQGNLQSFVAGITPYLKVKTPRAKILADFLSIPSGERCPELRESLYKASINASYSDSVETDMKGTDMKLVCAYIAGLLDTDGSISTGKMRNGGTYRNLTFTNTHKPVLEYIQKVFGGSIRVRRKEKDSWNLRYDLSISSYRGQEHCLLSLLPYLVVRRNRAIELLNVLRLHSVKIQPDLTGDRESVPAEMQEVALTQATMTAHAA